MTTHEPPQTAQAARLAAGLTLAQAAEKLQCSTGYLRQLERRGGWTWIRARQAAKVYGCRVEAFLYPTHPYGAEGPGKRRRAGGNATAAGPAGKRQAKR